MKKQYLWIPVLLVFAFLCSSSAPVTVEAAQTHNLHMTHSLLLEQEKWILDEVLCDNISEDVVTLMEKGVSYTVSDFIDKTTHTYVFFDQNLPEGTRYTAYGYAQTPDGSYAYFEITSSAILTEEMVDLEIAKTFGSSQTGPISLC